MGPVTSVPHTDLTKSYQVDVPHTDLTKSYYLQESLQMQKGSHKIKRIKRVPQNQTTERAAGI